MEGHMGERGITYNSNAEWLMDLNEDHSNLPEQDPVNITMADNQDIVSGMKSWTAQGPDMIQNYWVTSKLHPMNAWQLSYCRKMGATQSG